MSETSFQGQLSVSKLRSWFANLYWTLLCTPLLLHPSTLLCTPLLLHPSKILLPWKAYASLWSYSLVSVLLSSMNIQMLFSKVLSTRITVNISILCPLITLVPSHWPGSPRMSMTFCLCLISVRIGSTLCPHIFYNSFRFVRLSLF